MNTQLRHYSLLCLVVLMWALAWPITKMGLAFMSPLKYTAWRLLIGCLTMFAVALHQRQLCLPTRKDIPMLINIGVFQCFVFLSLVTIGLSHLQAGYSVVMVYMTPIWVTCGVYFIERDQVSRKKLLGVGLGMIGLFVLVNPLAVDWHSESHLIGNLMLLLASIVWAGTMMYTRYGKQHRSSVQLMPWHLLIATLASFFIAHVLEPHATSTVNSTLILTLLFDGALPTALAIWMAFEVTRRLPVIMVSLVLLLVPILGLLSSNLILHEPLTPRLLMSMMLILGAQVLVIEYRVRLSHEV